MIDIGGGDSRLADALLARRFTCISLLDVSETALARARERLGPRANTVTWINADVTGEWSTAPIDVWHDRAAFHFLVEPTDRARYLARIREFLRPLGNAIIATFALEGPPMCSGLPVARYSPESLADTLGPEFALMDAVADPHRTPSGARQAFWFTRFVYRPAARPEPEA